MRLATGLLVLLVSLAGCQSAEQNRPDRPLVALVPGKTTHAEVIEGLGAPQVVRRRGDRTVLTYTFMRREGTAVGVGNILVNLSVGDSLVGMEKLDVVLGPDRKVEFVRHGGYPAVETPGPWPFSD